MNQMKSVGLLCILSVFSLSLFGQNISGEWTGDGYQPGSPIPSSKLILDLTQNGPSISGIWKASYTNNLNIYCRYSIQGTFERGVFRFSESTLIEESTVGSIKCCRGAIKYELILKEEKDAFVLEGSGKGPNCPQMNVKFNKTNPCKDLAKLIDFHVDGVPAIPQPNQHTCWAACAAMMHSWKTKKNYSSNNIQDALLQIEGNRKGEFCKIFEESCNNCFNWSKGDWVGKGGLSQEESNRFFIDVMNLEYHNGSIFDLDFKECLPILAARCWKQPPSCKYQNGSHGVIITGVIGDGTPECTLFKVIDPWHRDDSGKLLNNELTEVTWTYAELTSCCQAYAYYPKISKVQYFENTPPKQIENIPIRYQKTIKVKSSKIKIFPFDNEKEDGDIVSIYVNGEWVLHQYSLKNWNNSSGHNKAIEINLPYKENNYLISKAWNVGSIKPNTLALKIDDGVSIQEIVINSELGLSGGLLINLEK